LVASVLPAPEGCGYGENEVFKSDVEIHAKDDEEEEK
jgi:hypothetical protein